MLKCKRRKVLEDLQSRLEDNLQSIYTNDGSFHYYNTGGGYYSSQNVDGTQMSGPGHMQGWPPGLADLIKRVAMATAVTIVDAIYTETEIEAKVEYTLLGDNNGVRNQD
jgi:hypothetical protein